MKKFNKVLALLLALIMVMATLPLSVIADSWAKVEVEDTTPEGATNEKSHNVTITVDPEALLTLIKEKGLSLDLLFDLKDGVDISEDDIVKVFRDLYALNIITLDELFEIVPKTDILKLFKLEEIITQLGGFGAIQKYFDAQDYTVLMETLLEDENASEKLADLLESVPNLEECVNPVTIMANGYIVAKAEGENTYSLIEKHLVEGAASALAKKLIVDVELIKKLTDVINGFDTLAEIDEFVHVDLLLADNYIKPSDVLNADAMDAVKGALTQYVELIHVDEEHEAQFAKLHTYIGDKKFAELEALATSRLKDGTFLPMIEGIVDGVENLYLIGFYDSQEEVKTAIDNTMKSLIIDDFQEDYNILLDIQYDLVVDVENKTLTAENIVVTVKEGTPADIFRACWKTETITIEDFFPDASQSSPYVEDMEGLIHFFLFEATDADGKYLLTLDDIAEAETAKPAAIALISDKTMLSEILTSDKYINYQKALELLGIDFIIGHIEGTYSTVKGYVNIPGLLADINLAATLENILDAVVADSVKLEDAVYVDKIINALAEVGKLSELAEMVDMAVIIDLLSNEECTEIILALGIDNVIRRIAPVLVGNLLDNIDKVTIDQVVVADERASTAQLQIYSQRIIELLLSKIPNIDDMLADGFDGKLFTLDTVIKYTVDSESEGAGTKKTKSVNFVFALGGDIKAFQTKLASLKEQLYDLYINEFEIDGTTITLDVNMPTAFAEIFKQIINDEDLSEELKQKLALIGTDENTLFDFVSGDLTIANIKALLNAIDPDELYAVMQNAGYLNIILEKYDAKTGASLSDKSLDEMLQYIYAVAEGKTLNEICDLLSAKLGGDVMALLEVAAGEYDKWMDRAEQISMVEDLLNKIGEKIGVDITGIDATELVDNNKEELIFNKIADKVLAKLGTDLAAVIEMNAQEIYDLAVEKIMGYETKINAVLDEVKALFDKLSNKELSMTLADYYAGNGRFEFLGMTKTYDPAAVAKKALKKVLSAIGVNSQTVETVLNAVIAEEPEATITVNLAVNFADIRKVTFVNHRKLDGNGNPTVLYTAFLPVGAKLNLFKEDLDKLGYKFTGWSIKDGDNWVAVSDTTEITEDVTVYADGNASLITFVDGKGKEIGVVMLPFGSTLADYEDGAWLNAIEDTIDVQPEGFNPNVSGDYTIHWYNEDGKDIDVSAQLFVKDTTLTYDTKPTYKTTIENANGEDIEYTLTEENGDYVLDIHEDAGWAHDHGAHVTMDSGMIEKALTEDVTFTVTVNGEDFITLDDKTLEYIAANKKGTVTLNYGTGYHNEVNERNSEFEESPFYNIENINIEKSTPEYHSFKLVDNHLEVDGEEVTVDLGEFGINGNEGTITVTLPYSALMDGVDRTHAYTVGADGNREFVAFDHCDYNNKKVTFTVSHFSDYVIVNEYKVDFSFKTEEGFIIGGIVNGLDAVNSEYYPAGETLNLTFTGLGNYTAVVNPIEVKGNTYTGELEYDAQNGVSYKVEADDVTLYVTLSGGIYYVFYNVDDASIVKEYNKNDLKVDANGASVDANNDGVYSADEIKNSKAFAEAWMTFDAFIEKMSLTAPAGYQGGAWLSFDEDALAKILADDLSNKDGIRNIIVNGQWKQVVYTYTVQFVDESNAVKGTETIADTPLTAIADLKALIKANVAVPTKEGYYVTWDVAGATLEGTTITVKAVYTANTYSVVVGDGNVVSNVTDLTKVPFGTEVKLSVPADKIPAGHKAVISAVLSTKNDKGEDIAIGTTGADGSFVFTMPADTVYVSVEYQAIEYTYTINGTAYKAGYGSTVPFSVTVPAGKLLDQFLYNGKTLEEAKAEQYLTLESMSVNANGDRVLNYNIVVIGDATITVEFRDMTPAEILYIFNGMVFGTNVADGVMPEVGVDNVQVSDWSETLWNSLKFANLSLINPNVSMLWLWILLIVILLLVIIAILYSFYIRGRLKPNFLMRFVVWVVDIFFLLGRAIAALGMKIAYLFGKSGKAQDYGFTEVEPEEIPEPVVPEKEITPEEVSAEEATNVEETPDEPAAEAIAIVEEAPTEEVTEEDASAEEIVIEEVEVVEEAPAVEAHKPVMIGSLTDDPISIEEVLADTPAEATEETTEAVAENTEEATAEVAEAVAEETTEEAPAEEATEEVTEIVAENTEMAVEETAEVAVEEESEIAVEEDSEIAVEEATEIAVEQETEIAVEENTEVAVEEEAEAVVEEESEELVEEATEEAVTEEEAVAEDDEDNKNK